MTLLIRPIEPDDVDAAVRVILGGSNAPEHEDPREKASYWAAVEETRVRRGDVLVAELDGEVVGVCQVLIFQHFQHTGGWCCEVESVHVRNDMRSQGIGAALMGAAEGLAVERGCYRVQLTSNTKREDAHRFYRRLGYSQSHQGFKKLLDAE
ncbi:MAG: GNAT family N-acetyltransferase [Acidimicrobiales bacterium]|jgi:GNAT superfamily N-acetyltransferase